jgi:hypothetical protein
MDSEKKKCAKWKIKKEFKKPCPKVKDFGMKARKATYRIWMYKQLHCRQLIVYKQLENGNCRIDPVPNVEYESTWVKQLKSTHVAGNGKTFKVIAMAVVQS